MDENNLNPTPMNDPEEQAPETDELLREQAVETETETEAEVQVVAESEEVAEAEIAEETEVSESAGDAVEVAEAAEDAENEETTETADSYEEEPMPEATEQPAKKKKSKGAIAVLVILVALLVATSVFLVSTIVSKVGSSKIDYDEIAVTVGDVDVTAGEYMYWYAYVDAYYYNYYSYYYSQISEDQIKADTLNQITFTSSLYSEAVNAGYTLSDEEIAELDESMANYEVAAEAASMEVDEYIAGNFGKGFTAEMLRSYLEKQAIAYRFYEDMMAQIDADFEGDGVAEKVENAYKANKLTYDLSDVSYFYFDATDEESEKKANSLISKITNDGMNFTDAVKAVTGDSEVKPGSLIGYAKDTLTSEFSEDGAKWIFETDADGKYVNGAGAVEKVDAGGMIYVLYVNEAPHRNEAFPVTLDYVEVNVATEDGMKSADELDVQAKSKANSILKEFENTDKSAESFAHLVLEYSESDDALINADALEDIVPDGDYDPAISDWAFAEDRKVGDYSLIKGEGSYIVVFYREKAESPVWYQSALTSLIQAEKSTWEADLLKEYETAVVTNDDMIDKAVKFIKSSMQQTQ